MRLPDLNLGNMDIKLKLGSISLNVLYVKFGYFYHTMPEHSHSLGSYELHYIPTGHGILRAQGQSYALSPGSLFVTGPDILHDQIPDLNDPMAEYCIFLEVLPEPPDTRKPYSTEETALPELLLSTPFWIGQDDGTLLQWFELLADELTRGQIGVHPIATNLLEIIVIRFLRHYKEDQALPLSLPQKTLDDNRLLLIENSFLYHYRTITLQQLANTLGLSTRQTERMVRKQYGISFQDKKQQARMTAASNLLLTTDRSISAIATQVGFTTPEHFSKAFKKYYGMTASQYKKQG